MAVSKNIRVYSNSASVSHQPTNGNVYWLWEENPYEDECYLDLDRKLFESEVRKSIGLRIMLERGILAVKEENFLGKFNLATEDEYIMNKKELEQFVNDSTIEEFEDYVNYAPQAMIDNIELIGTQVEITDRRKLKIFKEYTGKDLEEYYEDNDKVEKPLEKAKKGRKPKAKSTK